MSKKLFISVVPMLVTFAFAMAPTAAQAVEPTWYSEGTQIPEAAGEVPTVTWGNLSLKGAAEINCHNDIGGTASNKLVGGVLIGFTKIFDFSAWLCTSNFACPAGTFPGVEPQHLPWNDKLILVAGKIRDEVQGGTSPVGSVKVVIGCVVPPEDHVTGTAFIVGAGQKQTPLAPAGAKKGTGAAHPGFFEYDAGSGQLEAEGSGGTVTGITEGETKSFGYEEQEHIYAQ